MNLLATSNVVFVYTTASKQQTTMIGQTEAPRATQVKGCDSMGSEEEGVRTHHLLRAASIEQCDLATFAQS